MRHEQALRPRACWALSRPGRCGVVPGRGGQTRWLGFLVQRTVAMKCGPWLRLQTQVVRGAGLVRSHAA